MATSISRATVATKVEESDTAQPVTQQEDTIIVDYIAMGGMGVLPVNPLDEGSGYASTEAPLTSYTPTKTEETSTLA